MKSGIFEEKHVAILHFLTSASAAGPTQSGVNATGLPIARDSAGAIGLSDISGTTLPPGRSKCENTMTRAPFSASSRIVGACRSMRVASVDLPFFIGTFRSSRTNTRLPATSKSSSVRKSHRKNQISFAIATAVSAIRFEKPHSLSYHDITRTKFPLMTFV